MQFKCYSFSQLTTEQLYEVLALRANVFVVGQQCAYLDPDGDDKKAFHLLGTENNILVAYARIFPPHTKAETVVFGRVAVATSARGKGYGKLLMQELISYCREQYLGVEITCSAQHYLLRFYNELGFKAHGDVYDEAGIPHIHMAQ